MPLLPSGPVRWPSKPVKGEKEQQPPTSAASITAFPYQTHTPCQRFPLQVRPYNAAEVEGALQHATQQLHTLDLQQLSNIAGALAAAGHHNAAFMQQLGDAAAARLRAAPRLLQPADSLRAFRALCWLAVGFSRLGVVHPRLMEQVALYGTWTDSTPAAAGCWSLVSRCMPLTTTAAAAAQPTHTTAARHQLCCVCRHLSMACLLACLQAPTSCSAAPSHSASGSTGSRLQCWRALLLL